MPQKSLLAAALLAGFGVSPTLLAQGPLTYRTPPPSILQLADAKLAPRVLVDDAGEYMILRERNAYVGIEDLAKEELRLAGLRIDPKTDIGSRTYYYTGLSVKSLTDPDAPAREVTGLPAKPKLANFAWSPDEEHVAMTHTTADAVELWVLDVEGADAKRVHAGPLNANMGDVLNWLTEDELLVKTVSREREPLTERSGAVPTGPSISSNDGAKAQNRTYQDLLQDPYDEHDFAQLARAELVHVNLQGRATPWLGDAMYTGVDVSPDGEYVLVSEVSKPFSYLVPYGRFPTTYTVYDKSGERVAEVADIPLIEELPKGFMAERTGRRDFEWRADRPHTLVYAEVLDGGDPDNEVAFRDEVSQLGAPFTGEGQSLLKTTQRFWGVEWGDDETAVAYDLWWPTRNVKTYVFDPSDASAKPRVLSERNYQDRYSDPGNTVTVRGPYGEDVLAMDGGGVYMLGDGYTEAGQFPFLTKVHLATGATDTLYKSRYTDRVESLYDFNPKQRRLLVGIESPSDYPNFYFRKTGNGAHDDATALTQLTDFANPFAAIAEAHKEVINYQRADGVALTGTLYLPPGYDRSSGEKLPMIMWAYPREYKDKSSAGQNTSNANEFTYPFWGSMLYWVTRGYAVLDDAAFPIVGEGDEEPNDSFREQLVANARAGIDAVDALGYIDRDRVAVGGHSYGAFMVANLLAHSDLFAAGIARSGAYNRTLTPFGFQSEERSYWDSPDTYNTMSPFMHADKVNEPLLLIHGAADNNSGTYPMQSERYFNALKGLGATTRLVMFPHESHGYRSRETIMHLLWEQDEWLAKYVKGGEGNAVRARMAEAKDAEDAEADGSAGE